MTITGKTELLPTSGSPEFTPRDEYDPADDDFGVGPYDTEYESVGWDLSFGSRINFGPDADGNLRVLLNLSDDALANAMVCRNVTDVQVIAFARHLLTLTKGDDDIETIAVKLAETAAQFNQRIAEKAEELAAPRVADARQRVAESRAELERVGEFHEQRIADLQREQARQVAVLERRVEQLQADLARAEGTR